MSKLLPATCVGQTVKLLGSNVALQDVEILSEGEGESSGFVLIDDTKLYYLPNIVPDLKTTIQKVIDALGHVTNGLSGLNNAGYLISAVGGVPSPILPAVSAAANGIDTAKSALSELLGELK